MPKTCVSCGKTSLDPACEELSHPSYYKAAKMPGEPKGKKGHLQLAAEWKDVPHGTPVILVNDDGTEFHTRTRSMPWMLGASPHDDGHTAVIMVDGITGGYGLWRIRKA